jgi:hypothetical protein
MRQRIADYGDILEKTHMKLIDIIRLVPEHFKLVERENRGSKIGIML